METRRTQQRNFACAEEDERVGLCHSKTNLVAVCFFKFMLFACVCVAGFEYDNDAYARSQRALAATVSGPAFNSFSTPATNNRPADPPRAYSATPNADARRMQHMQQQQQQQMQMQATMQRTQSTPPVRQPQPFQQQQPPATLQRGTTMPSGNMNPPPGTQACCATCCNTLLSLA